MSASRSYRPFPILALASMAILGLTACGDDDAVAATDGADGPPPIEVTMVDFDYPDLPASIPAGTQLTVTNDAEEELHEVVAFRLPDDETRSVDELAELPPPELVAALGEPQTVLLAPPGGEMIPAVGDGVLREPGRYGIFCFIPAGVDPQVYLDAAAETEEGPPQVEGGAPHFVLGMRAELMVE